MLFNPYSTSISDLEQRVVELEQQNCLLSETIAKIEERVLSLESNPSNVATNNLTSFLFPKIFGGKHGD